MMGEKVAKLVGGVTHVPPVAAPVARASSGLMATVSFPPGGGCGVLVTATLSADDTRRGELTFMTVATDLSAMVLERRAFLFNTEPPYGIAKVVWAGVSVVGVMSSSGEVVCVRSGLVEKGDNDDDDVDDYATDNEEGNEAMFVGVMAHALDICGITVGGCSFVVISGHQKLQCFTFQKQCASGEMKHKCRELNFGPFHSIAGVADDRNGPAILLGCTLGSIVVLEWTSPLDGPVVIRSIIMGPSTRYIGIAVNASEHCESGRQVTFCAFGDRTLDGKEELEDVELKRTDGSLFDIPKATGSFVSSLPSWNTVLHNAPSRPHAGGVSLLVTRPQLHRSSSVNCHALLINVTQSVLNTAGSCFHGMCCDKVGRFPSTVNIKVIDAASTDCKKALARLNSAVTVLPTLRRTKSQDSHEYGELCLCDGQRAIFFGFTEKGQMMPRSVLCLESRHDRLLGCCWFPESLGVMVLSGTLLNAFEEASENIVMKNGEKEADVSASVVGQIVLSSREPLPWEYADASAPLTLEQVQEVVRTIVQEENERMLARLERRLDSLERTMSLLLPVTK
ncbi:hypothetical protein MOQ_006344 [Trypanosoma cruzi marinkellei]|uniref:Uncharacterized protein n=1 Tax=Trypanosoma cruzi marinkellei TaxID=85056 RepID=K2M4G0_TRYCR|nr:hypothetical protein MOQ_006344 [Trypanosoma cruzi marinkellei]